MHPSPTETLQPDEILAVDIGAGTQDILLYRPGREEENNPQLVLPTPSKVWTTRLARVDKDLFIYGDTIGGGSIGATLTQHLTAKKRRVFMTEHAAQTIRDDPDQVRAMGIEIVRGRPAYHDSEDIELKELDLPFLENILHPLGEGHHIALVAIAVQDHGVPPRGVSDRAFRFSWFRTALEKGHGWKGLTYSGEEIPPCFSRMRSVAQRALRDSAPAILIVDTAISAILGAKKTTPEPQLVLNIGNGHTVMALIINGEISGLLEHHTALLTPRTLRDYVVNFPKGMVSNEAVYADGGHGSFLSARCPHVHTISVTGPRRRLMHDTALSHELPAPGGNMMLTGPWGLVSAARLRGLSS